MDDCTTKNGWKRGTRMALTGDLISFLSDAYALDSSSTFTDLGGSCNLNLLVVHHGVRYVAKVYRPYVTEERLECIREAMRAAGAFVPCAERLPTKTGAEHCAWNGRLIEVEKYVPHNRTMNGLEQLRTAMPLFERLHRALSAVGDARGAWDQPFCNFVSADRALALTREGCARIRSWKGLSDTERAIADAAEALAERLSGMEPRLPRQLTHGDFWDNNVLFQDDRIVLVTDFDFIGMRPRVDDIALTFYFADYEFVHAGLDVAEIRRRFRSLADAYCRDFPDALTERERLAIPLAMARQPLWSVGVWARLLDEERTARAHISDLLEYLERAAGIVDSLEQWQEALVEGH